MPPSTTMSIHFILLLFTTISTVSTSQTLTSSRTKTILRIDSLLSNPPVLSTLTAATDLCLQTATPTLTISCSSNSQITKLSITGDRPPNPHWKTALPSSFSIDSLFTTLAYLSAELTDLSLVNLGIWGAFPDKLHRFPLLKNLNLSSNYIYGNIPMQISSMYNLSSLVLSNNFLNGTVPGLQNLTILEELDLGFNHLGPEFPTINGKSIVRLVLKNNSFHCKIPDYVGALAQLQFLDLSENQFSGWIPSSVFSLPEIQFVDLSENNLTGQLPTSMTCANTLASVDISSNMLSGTLPSCVRTMRTLVDYGNCFQGVKLQRPSSYCNPGALAAVLPPPQKSGEKSGGGGGGGVGLGLILGILGGIVGGVIFIGLVMVLVVRKMRARKPEGGGKGLVHASARAALADKCKNLVHASPRAAPADKRHALQGARINVLEVRPYHVFTLEELEEATNSFDASNLIKDTPQGQHYKGWVENGSMIMVRCLKIKQNHATQNLAQYMEIVSKLRHRHLVSIIGHCIVNDPENSNIASTVYLVSECVLNGTLRSHITEWRKREMLKWPQRVSTAIGVARGIQFLHSVTTPGIAGNDLNIENILLDQTLSAKISNFNLPILLNTKNGKVTSESPFAVKKEKDRGSVRSIEQGEQEDIYQIGLILLEIITGKPPGSQNQLDSLKAQLLKGLADDSDKLKGMVDPAIHGTFAVESLRTVIELALNCTSNNPKERPPIDDVLWNLQYSVQVQDGWASSESLSLSV